MPFSVTDVDAIFAAAIELSSPEERAEYVQRVCGESAESGSGLTNCWQLILRPEIFSSGDTRLFCTATTTSSRAGHGHRAVQAAGADRRRRHWRRLHGRAAGAGPPQGGPEGHQAGHGHPAGDRPLRGRAAGPGADGPPEHRQGARRRHDRHGPAVLRDGAGQGRADHRVLRRAPAHARAAAGAVRAGLPGGAARPPEGDHPPRPQAVERPGHAARRQAGRRR